MTEEQILAQELANVQQRNAGYGEKEIVDENEIYKKLSEDFPEEALTKDSSRGFDLTSVKAQYVIERLNKVLGVMNWTFGGEFKETDEGVLYMGVLVISINGKENRHFAPGFAKHKKNVGDTYKSAHTDSLSKAASKFGIANSVFKGLVEPPGTKKTKRTAVKSTVSKTISKPATEKSTEVAVKPKTSNKPSSFKTRTRRTRPELKVN